jgi:hypothetical protein
MRPSIAILLLLLAACTQVDSFTPTITALAANNGVNDRTPLALPFRMCDVPAHFTVTDSFGPLPDPVVFIIIGSGFMPQVANATESGGTYRSPLVALEGPATYQAVGSGVFDPERISFRLDYGDQPFADGLYAVSVRNPDESETVTARLANAVQIVPPPRAVPSVASVCLISPATVVFRGGPFVPGLRVTASASQPDLETSIDAVDQVTVDIPSGANTGPSLVLTFLDPTGCKSSVSIPVSCP